MGTRVEFTAAADGDYTIACEHTNYLFGPNEVYHLSVKPVAADFAVGVAFDPARAHLFAESVSSKTAH